MKVTMSILFAYGIILLLHAKCKNEFSKMVLWHHAITVLSQCVKNLLLLFIFNGILSSWLNTRKVEKKLCVRGDDHV